MKRRYAEHLFERKQEMKTKIKQHTAPLISALSLIYKNSEISYK